MVKNLPQNNGQPLCRADGLPVLGILLLYVRTNKTEYVIKLGWTELEICLKPFGIQL